METINESYILVWFNENVILTSVTDEQSYQSRLSSINVTEQKMILCNYCLEMMLLGEPSRRTGTTHLIQVCMFQC